jgi:hypothetical protein
MTPRNWIRRPLAAGLAVAVLGSATACGTILYPERRGQTAGRIDAAVVILDAVGLLFFFVPGVVAFAVDFGTGAIYLPKGERSRIGEVPGEHEIERYALAGRSIEAVEAALEVHAGLRVDLRCDGIPLAAPVPPRDITEQLLELNRNLGEPVAPRSAPGCAAARESMSLTSQRPSLLASQSVRSRDGS